MLGLRGGHAFCVPRLQFGGGVALLDSNRNGASKGAARAHTAASTFAAGIQDQLPADAEWIGRPW